jgi:hypothetical protein
MSSDSELSDPLLRAIGELRMDVLQLIDEQIAHVKQRVDELPSAPALRPAPVPPIPETPEETPKDRTLDPRKRLDALAKHLDHRLRQVNVPPAERVDRSPGQDE